MNNWKTQQYFQHFGVRGMLACCYYYFFYWITGAKNNNNYEEDLRFRKLNNIRKSFDTSSLWMWSGLWASCERNMYIQFGWQFDALGFDWIYPTTYTFSDEWELQKSYVQFSVCKWTYQGLGAGSCLFFLEWIWIQRWTWRDFHICSGFRYKWTIDYELCHRRFDCITNYGPISGTQ